ncbi:MAG: TatD family hydrolase [Motiliproteus sp.]
MTACHFFDTHCHLDFPDFDQSISSLLAECEQQGVAAIAIPGVRAEYWSRVMTLCARHQGLCCALGLHPCFLTHHHDTDLEKLRNLAESGACVAVGEIGLDFWDGGEDEELQRYFFEAQLAVAKDCQLPVLLHVRKAHDHVLKILRRYRLEKAGIVHAFSGSQQQAGQYIQLGFKLGVGGSITYPRAQRLRKLVANLPMDSIVLETDAPDMPLHGRQGKVNRPDYLPLVFAVLASLRKEQAGVLKRQLWRNSTQIFNG